MTSAFEGAKPVDSSSPGSETILLAVLANQRWSGAMPGESKVARHAAPVIPAKDALREGGGVGIHTVSLEQELISRGLRMTHQRRLLIEIIQSAESHLDAIALWERARGQDPTLNKVTVYRTLAMLKKLGLVDELDLMHLEGGKHYYEARASRDHIHLACLKCGRIQEFESSLFEKLKGQIERQRRFNIKVVRVEAGGYCDNCRER